MPPKRKTTKANDADKAKSLEQNIKLGIKQAVEDPSNVGLQLTQVLVAMASAIVPAIVLPLIEKVTKPSKKEPTPIAARGDIGGISLDLNEKLKAVQGANLSEKVTTLLVYKEFFDRIENRKQN